MCGPLLVQVSQRGVAGRRPAGAPSSPHPARRASASAPAPRAGGGRSATSHTARAPMCSARRPPGRSSRKSRGAGGAAPPPAARGVGRLWARVAATATAAAASAANATCAGAARVRVGQALAPCMPATASQYRESKPDRAMRGNRFAAAPAHPHERARAPRLHLRARRPRRARRRQPQRARAARGAAVQQQQQRAVRVGAQVPAVRRRACRAARIRAAAAQPGGPPSWAENDKTVRSGAQLMRGQGLSLVSCSGAAPHAGDMHARDREHLNPHSALDGPDRVAKAVLRIGLAQPSM